MRNSLGFLAFGMALSLGPIGATDNPFLDLVRDGCQKAGKEIDGAERLCIGPSSHTGADQLRIIDDLLS